MNTNPISSENILQAITTIRSEGVPKDYQNTPFNLVFEGRLYPARYVFHLAVQAANSNLPLDDTQINRYFELLGFTVQPRQTDWSWRECYFAVWAYDLLEMDRSIVKAVLYREIAELIGRSKKSVEFKIQNVSSFDPRPRAEKPISEAPNAQQLLGEVFRWYWSDRSSARALQAQFREEFQFNLASTAEVVTPQEGGIPQIIIEEGATYTATVTLHKRSQKLLEEGRKYFSQLERDGRLRCKSCGFTTPSGLSTEVIQLHHTEPIYDSPQEGRRLELQKALSLLVPLCPTCHSLAHTSRPPLSVSAIQALKGA